MHAHNRRFLHPNRRDRQNGTLRSAYDKSTAHRAHVHDAKVIHITDNKITVANMEEAENVLTHIERYVYMQDAEIARKCADIALKLIGGEQLNQLEEQFLLKKLEIAD